VAKKSNHTDESGQARMVDVGDKNITSRKAIAEISVNLNDDSFEAVKQNRSKKGDILNTARLAGIQAAKKTSELIPLCHQILLNCVLIDFNIIEENNILKIRTEVSCSGRTGVEMEALTGCSVAALTVYDMLKSIQKDIEICDLHLLKKKEVSRVSTSGQIFKISISKEKGEQKHNVDSAFLVEDKGIKGDAHAGSERQVSLLPFESFDKMINDVMIIHPGDFAENLTITGLDFSTTKVGDVIKIGNNIILEVTQIGKECHNGCRIREVVGDCIMPREGIFARVVKGGPIKSGDPIRWQ